MKIDVKKLYDKFGADLKYTHIVRSGLSGLRYELVNQEDKMVVSMTEDVVDISMNDESVLLCGHDCLFRLSLEEYLHCKNGYIVVEGANMFRESNTNVVLSYEEALKVYHKVQLDYIKEDIKKFCYEEDLATYADHVYETMAKRFMEKYDSNCSHNDTIENVVKEYIRTEEKRKKLKSFCHEFSGGDGFRCNSCPLGQIWCNQHTYLDADEDTLDIAIKHLNNALNGGIL